MLKWLLITSLCILLCPQTVMAVVDPLATPNNKYGVHISTEADLDDAAKLVNSSGGDWGYVTVVVQDLDQNTAKWQAMFNRMRELHLIPLVRLATHFENGVWVKPLEHQIGSWVGFLNSLNWVTQNRYVILFNEPNHAKEWGGSISPEEYARVAGALATALRQSSDDFFILPAGLDAAAPTGTDTLDSADFWRRVHSTDPNFFRRLDGWVSHAYPNPGFVGRPNDTGKMSIRGYRWEIDLLKDFGLAEEIPIFITETGWVHQEGRTRIPGYLSTSVVANYFAQAFEQVWTDTQLVAVTPFILRYDEPPFDHFSLTRPDNQGYYPQYDRLVSLPKQAGQPQQIDSFRYETSFLPTSLLTDGDYMVKLTFTNTGQTIWDGATHAITLSGDVVPDAVWVSQLEKTKPGEAVDAWARFSTLPQPGGAQLKIGMTTQGRPFGNEVYHEFVTETKASLVARFKIMLQLLLHPTLFNTAYND